MLRRVQQYIRTQQLLSPAARVLVCVRPESQQVVECLNNPVCLTVENLIVPASQLDERCEGMTGGIPALVAACNSDIGDDDELVETDELKEEDSSG